MKSRKIGQGEITLLGLIAYQAGQISEGRCVELTGYSRNEIRAEMHKRVGRYAPYNEACDELDGLKKKCDALISAIAAAAVIDHREDCSTGLCPSGKCDCGYAELQAAIAAINQVEDK